MKEETSSTSKSNKDIQIAKAKADYEPKSQLSILIGSFTCLLFFIFLYWLSQNIAIYFATHKPLNSSEIVQSISSSLNTLIVGLSFLATFSFAFIGLGLFIVFIRSFLIKKN